MRHHVTLSRHLRLLLYGSWFLAAVVVCMLRVTTGVCVRDSIGQLIAWMGMSVWVRLSLNLCLLLYLFLTAVVMVVLGTSAGVSMRDSIGKLIAGMCVCVRITHHADLCLW